MNYRETIIKERLSQCRKFFNHLTETEKEKVVAISSKRNITYHDFNDLQIIGESLEVRR